MTWYLRLRESARMALDVRQDRRDGLQRIATEDLTRHRDNALSLGCVHLADRWDYLLEVRERAEGPRAWGRSR